MARSCPDAPLHCVGRYYLTEKLSVGAMHVVYKGVHPKSGKAVAVKVATLALTRQPELLKRFEQEYRVTSSIQHPNVVRGLDFGWEGGQPFLVMEFVDGESLAARLERLGPLPEAEAVGYITQVAQGLAEAHKDGIIHRDIKPDNILLAADGQAKLADLGLSKDLEADVQLTRAGRGLGTPNFMAPEQFNDAKNAGPRCDIYSLGATLYMAVTGELPFAGRGLLATLKQKRADELTPPRQRVPALSERIDWAIRRAVLAEPSRRFGSCREFIAALAGDSSELTELASANRRPAPSATGRERERRGSVRYDCVLPIQCTIHVSLHAEDTEWQAQWDAQVVDLSVTGIGLVLSRRFEPGTELTAHLVSGNGSVKHTRALRVLRVRRAAGKRWHVGGTLLEKLSRDELRSLL